MRTMVQQWMVLGLCILALGCSPGDTGTVDGRVVVDGNPMGGFEVRYIGQTDGATYMGYAKEDGSYELFGGRGNRNVKVGEYKVVIAPTGFVENVPMPSVKLPPKYTDRSQAETVKKVNPGENQIDIEVEST